MDELILNIYKFAQKILCTREMVTFEINKKPKCLSKNTMTIHHCHDGYCSESCVRSIQYFFSYVHSYIRIF